MGSALQALELDWEIVRAITGMARAMVIRRDKRRLILDRKCAEIMQGMSYICRLLRTWGGQRELQPIVYVMATAS